MEERLRVKRGSDEVEDFDRDKLERSLDRAAGGRLSPRQIKDVADQILMAIRPKARVISTRDLGREAIRKLNGNTPAGALRYAMTWLTTRREATTPAELLTWVSDNLPAVHPRSAPMPRFVLRNYSKERGYASTDSFEIAKLWESIFIATKGLAETAKWVAPPTATLSAHKVLTGVITLSIIGQFRGQETVTAGQLSAASMSTLREVVPFGYLRYAAIAKKYLNRDALINEIQGLIDYPSLTSEEIASPAWQDRWNVLASEAEELGVKIQQYRNAADLS
jgi:transcriptional regulator NrdR family protein